MKEKESFLKKGSYQIHISDASLWLVDVHLPETNPAVRTVLHSPPLLEPWNWITWAEHVKRTTMTIWKTDY